MKINIKPKAEPTIQRNLRVPVSFNKQMNDTAALADQLGVDYHATLLSALEQFNTEFDARLREMKSKGESTTTSGIIPGTESIPDSVDHHSPPVGSITTTPATDSVAPTLRSIPSNGVTTE